MPQSGRWVLLVCLATAASLATLGAARAASPFDGAWTVSQSCPPTADDVHGYAWTYPAAIRNGMLSGRHGASADGGGSIRLQGRIGPDGSAMLDASGLTGHSEYSVGHVAPGKPVHYHVQAHFDRASGSGSRVELRQCSFTFARG